MTVMKYTTFGTDPTQLRWLPAARLLASALARTTSDKATSFVNLGTPMVPPFPFYRQDLPKNRGESEIGRS